MSENKTATTLYSIKGASVDMNERTFEGLANTWELDLGGDVVHRGAFKRTLDHWKSSGRIIPLLDSHDAFSSVQAVVGKMVDAKETSEGLWAKFQVIDDARGDGILSRLQGGYVDGLSIGYRPIKQERPSDSEARQGIVRHLKEVELREVSVVVFPMNESSRVKHDADAEKDGATEPEHSAALEEPTGSDDSPDGLAPDDPERIELEERVRALRIAGLGLR